MATPGVPPGRRYAVRRCQVSFDGRYRCAERLQLPGCLAHGAVGRNDELEAVPCALASQLQPDTAGSPGDDCEASDCRNHTFLLRASVGC
jgi:hypothetical protein